MDSLEYIDNYFKGEQTADEIKEFEQKIINDPGFADEVAYYMVAFEALKEQSTEERKRRFREIYAQSKQLTPVVPFRRKVWSYVAAAAVIAGVIFGGYFLLRPSSPQQLADHYIQSNLQTLSLKMEGRQDSMQKARDLYNNNHLTESLQYFQSIIQSDTSNYEPKRDAGIVSLRLKQYDQALNYFKQLETYNTLHANPALLYQALTLMERNNPGDVEQAKQLLQQVVQNDLEGKKVAEGWLKKL